MMQGCALCGYIEMPRIPLSKEIIRKKKLINLGQAQVHWKYTERHPKRENKIQMKSNKMQAVQHSNKTKRSESKAGEGEVACSHSN